MLILLDGAAFTIADSPGRRKCMQLKSLGYNVVTKSTTVTEDLCEPGHHIHTLFYGGKISQCDASQLDHWDEYRRKLKAKVATFGRVDQYIAYHDIEYQREDESDWRYHHASAYEQDMQLFHPQVEAYFSNKLRLATLKRPKDKSCMLYAKDSGGYRAYYPLTHFPSPLSVYLRAPCDDMLTHMYHEIDELHPVFPIGTSRFFSTLEEGKNFTRPLVALYDALEHVKKVQPIMNQELILHPEKYMIPDLDVLSDKLNIPGVLFDSSNRACYVGVEPRLSTIGQPAKLGLFAARTIRAGEAITWHGGAVVPTDAQSEHRSPFEIMPGMSLDGTMLRAAIPTFVPSTQLELNALYALNAESFHYDWLLLNTGPQSDVINELFDSGLGYMANDCIQMLGFVPPNNCEYKNVSPELMQGSPLKLKYLVANKDIYVGQQLFVAGNALKDPVMLCQLKVSEFTLDSQSEESLPDSLRIKRDIEKRHFNAAGKDVPSAATIVDEDETVPAGPRIDVDELIWYVVDGTSQQCSTAMIDEFKVQGFTITLDTARNKAKVEAAPISVEDQQLMDEQKEVASQILTRSMANMSSDQKNAAFAAKMIRDSQLKTAANIREVKKSTYYQIDTSQSDEVREEKEKLLFELFKTSFAEVEPENKVGDFSKLPPILINLDPQQINDVFISVDLANKQNVVLKVNELYSLYSQMTPYKQIERPGLMSEDYAANYKFFGAILQHQSYDILGENDSTNSSPLLPMVYVPARGDGNCGIRAADLASNPELMMQRARLSDDGFSASREQNKIETDRSIEARKQ